MTAFDRLEAQLLDAHARRHRRMLPRPTGRHVLAFAVAAAAVVAILVAGLAGDSGTGSRSAAQPAAAVAPVVPASTAVVVLNASRQPGRARDVAYALARRGWHISRVTNYPGAPLSSSCVDFTPGHSEAASMVASQLSIHNVLPPNPDAVTAAGPDAQVIVIVGRDQIHRVR
jgi:hypothetical protein